MRIGADKWDYDDTATFTHRTRETHIFSMK